MVGKFQIYEELLYHPDGIAVDVPALLRQRLCLFLNRSSTSCERLATDTNFHCALWHKLRKWSP